MSEPGSDNKQRNRQIAENERVQQATGAARVSIWAIAVAVVIAIAAFGWVWLRR